jgi:hypothetical protein
MKRHRRDFYDAELLDEACSISNDLGRVIFIGAVAIYLHTDGGLERRTRDFDCSIAYEVSDKWLESKRYIKNPNTRNEYRTPRDKKLDIYKGDISRIPFGTIIERPEIFDIESRKVRVAAVKLEVLILMKMRANRSYDREDLILLCREKNKMIDLNYLRNIASEIEFKELEMIIETLS